MIRRREVLGLLTAAALPWSRSAQAKPALARRIRRLRRPNPVPCAQDACACSWRRPRWANVDPGLRPPRRQWERGARRGCAVPNRFDHQVVHRPGSGEPRRGWNGQPRRSPDQILPRIRNDVRGRAADPAHRPRHALGRICRAKSPTSRGRRTTRSSTSRPRHSRRGSRPIRSCSRRGRRFPIPTSALICWPLRSPGPRISPMRIFSRRVLFEPLGLQDTTFAPRPSRPQRIMQGHNFDGFADAERQNRRCYRRLRRPLFERARSPRLASVASRQILKRAAPPRGSSTMLPIYGAMD